MGDCLGLCGASSPVARLVGLCLTVSPSTKRDTGGGPISGESVLSAAAAHKASISSLLSGCQHGAPSPRQPGNNILHGGAWVGLVLVNGWQPPLLFSKRLRIHPCLTPFPLRRAPGDTRPGLFQSPLLWRMPLGRRFEPQAPKQGRAFGELCLQLCLDFERMVGYPSRAVILDLLLQAQYVAAELEVLGQQARAVIFEPSYLL